MIGARYRYAATGFPMEYWDYYSKLRPWLQRLYKLHARGK